jgi:hypothetical protein
MLWNHLIRSSSQGKTLQHLVRGATKQNNGSSIDKLLGFD